MDETRDPDLKSKYARHLYGELNKPGADERMWEELKRRTPVDPETGLPRPMESRNPREENKYFAEITQVLEEPDWDALVEVLKRVDLEDEEEDYVNANGLQVSVEEYFVQLASDLKECSPVRFKEDIKLSNRHFFALKSHLDTLRKDSNEFLSFAYDLKIIFPSQFKDINITDSFWQSIAEELEQASAQEEWEYFLQLFEQSYFVSNGEIQRFFKIDEAEWAKILSFIGGLGIEERVRKTAQAQQVRRENFPAITVSNSVWQSYVNSIKYRYLGSFEQNAAWEFVARARAVKYLKVEE